MAPKTLLEITLEDHLTFNRHSSRMS